MHLKLQWLNSPITNGNELKRHNYPGKTILHLFARYMQEKQETCKINAILQEYSFARFAIKILARKYTISCKGSCILAR